MKIVAIADTHMCHADLKMPKGDMLLVAGDCLGYGTIEEAIEFNKWLGTLDYKHKIIVPGNHDRCAQADPEGFKKIITNGKVLIHEPITIDGTRIFGMPWTPAFGYWAFMYPRGSFDGRKLMLDIPLDTQILITHGPAYGTDLGITRDGEDAGCPLLRERLGLMKDLRIHVHGHIHRGYGYTQLDKINCYNVTVVNECYDPVYDPTEIGY
jgi:Icc-related predicted phosphoesterase